MTITRLSELVAEAKRHKDLEVRSAVLADFAEFAEELFAKTSDVRLEEFGAGTVMVCHRCDRILNAGTLNRTVFGLMRSAMAHECDIDR